MKFCMANQLANDRFWEKIFIMQMLLKVKYVYYVKGSCELIGKRLTPQ